MVSEKNLYARLENRIINAAYVVAQKTRIMIQFIFSSFWTFAGFVILLSVTYDFILNLIDKFKE